MDTPCVGILSGYFNKLQRKNRLSIDQAIADRIGGETRFKSLVFQAGENLNFSQISWDKHGLPVKQIDSPRKIFNLLFEVDENAQAQKQVLAEDRSILDSVLSQAQSMEKRLNHTDRAKLDEYMTSVREVEQTVKRRAYWADRSKPQSDYKIEENSIANPLTIMSTFSTLRCLPWKAIPPCGYGSDSFWEGFKEPELSGNYSRFVSSRTKARKIEKLMMLERGILSRISDSLAKMKNRTVGERTLSIKPQPCLLHPWVVLTPITLMTSQHSYSTVVFRPRDTGESRMADE